MKDGIYLFSSSAFVAGLALTITSSPIDIVKNRVMS